MMYNKFKKSKYVLNPGESVFSNSFKMARAQHLDA